jgi:hypothetical protein
MESRESNNDYVALLSKFSPQGTTFARTDGTVEIFLTMV